MPNSAWSSSVPLARRRQISSAAVAGCGRSLTAQCLNLKEPRVLRLSSLGPVRVAAVLPVPAPALTTGHLALQRAYIQQRSLAHSGAPAGCSGGGGRGPLDVPSAHGAVTPVPSRAAAVAGPVRCGPMQRGFVWSGQPVAPGALLVERCRHAVGACPFVRPDACLAEVTSFCTRPPACVPDADQGVATHPSPEAAAGCVPPGIRNAASTGRPLAGRRSGAPSLADLLQPPAAPPAACRRSGSSSSGRPRRGGRRRGRQPGRQQGGFRRQG